MFSVPLSWLCRISTERGIVCTITSMSLIQRQPGDVDLACLLHLLETIFSCKLSKLFEQLKLKLNRNTRKCNSCKKICICNENINTLKWVKSQNEVLPQSCANNPFSHVELPECYGMLSSQKRLKVPLSRMNRDRHLFPPPPPFPELKARSSSLFCDFLLAAIGNRATPTAPLHKVGQHFILERSASSESSASR